MRRSYKPRLAISTIMMLLLTMTIVMSGGTAAYPAVSYKWNRQESGTTGPIHDAVAIDAAHVWAVTGTGEILFFNGAAWSVQENYVGESLYGIDAVDNNKIWAVGYDGVIHHYNGSSWESQDSGTAVVSISAVSALDSSHVWAAGGDGRIFFYDGFSWTSQSLDSSVSFEGIYALDASHVWAVGGGRGPKAGQGIAWFFDGSAWSEKNTGAGSTLFDVFAMDAQHVWAVGGRGEIRFFDGSSWTGQASNTDVILYGVTVVGGHAWAVGEQGTILYSEDLRNWTTSSSGVTNVLRSITGLDSQHLWAVGDDGVILSAELMPAPPFTPTARTWGHDSIGVTAPATAWYLAEGSTGKNEVDSFETWVLLANPGSEKATAHVFYMTPNGEKTGPTVELAAGTRKTINVADTVAGEWSVSTRVSSDKPILAERAMYGNKRTWGHDSIGVTAPATAWYLAEGSTGTDQYNSFETWVLVQNPNPNNVDVDLTFMTLSGVVQGPTATVPANSRMTFNVADYVPNTFDISTKVVSSGPAGANDVIVERAMYGSGT